MDASEINRRKWLEDRIKFFESECLFLRGELRAIKALVGRKYASDTEEEEKEETEEKKAQ